MILLIIAYIIPIAVLVSMLIMLFQGNIRRQRDVITFQAFLLILVFWLIFLWLTDLFNQPDISLKLLRFALMFGSFAPAFFFVFSEQFIHRSSKLINVLFFTVSTAFAILSLSPLMVGSVKKGSLGVLLLNPTKIYALQTLYTIIALGFSYIWLRRAIRRTSRSNTAEQIRIIGVGMLLALLVGVVGGYVLNTSGSNLLLPLAVVIFAGCIFLAIFRHGLFDIRLLVARSSAYLLSLLSLGFLFGITTFTLTNFLLGGKNLDNQAVRWLYIILAVALAFAFPPLKRFFNKISNRLFYRYSYDAQALLDNFNKILVTTFGLNPILRKSIEIVEKNITPTYCAFIIKKTENMPGRTIGKVIKSNFSESDIESALNKSPKISRKVIVADLLENKYQTTQKTLHNMDISLIARLTSNVSEEGIGYLILGPKKTGDMYSPQDYKVIEIIANELVIAIQNALHTEEIENFNITLQNKVDDATRKLRRTNERLEELDETKDDFISMASHQLRTPLTSVKGYLSMVLEGDAGKVNPNQYKMLHQAFASSQRMVYLITDLLNVSRLKTGKFVIEPIPVNLNKLMEEEVAQLAETAEVKNVALNYKKPTDFPLLMLDETKIRQVGMNFIDNAIYYTPSGGHIDVTLTNNPTTIEMIVTDTGIGVPKAEQHHLFTKFYRATNARKVRPDGTGLGLFMAKKVIAAQGGSLIFESKEGQGSTFGFVFSKAKLKITDTQIPKIDETALHSVSLKTTAPAAKTVTSAKR